MASDMTVNLRDAEAGEVQDVQFNVSGSIFTVRRKQAELLAENLRLFAGGKFQRDVAEVARLGINPGWAAEGALPMAEVMEDVLAGRIDFPIPLDEGKGAEALFGALSLITDVQPERAGAIGLRDSLRTLLIA
ncbi:MAG TPA: hypothetical protein VF259_05285 [Solirubrobacterales bacterium]